MKPRNFTFSIVAALLIILSACGKKIADNKYLGSLPGLAANYAENILDKEVKIKENTDLEKVFKLGKELELLEDEADEKLEMAFNEMQPESLPFEYKGDPRFVMEDIKVSGATFDVISLEANIRVKEEINNKYSNPERYLFAYLKFYDSDNNPLEGWAVLAINLPYKEEFKPGQTYTMNGSYRGLSKLVNFSSITVFDRDEYEQNH